MLSHVLKTLVLSAGLLAATHARADTCFGSDSGSNRIFQVDLTNGALSNSTPITLAGFAVSGITSITANPVDGTVWGVVKTGTGNTGRKLCRINTTTGVASLVGGLPNGFSSLSFSPAGALFGMTGQGGTPASTLFSINTCDATATALGVLASGADGEVIAFGAGGTLYHSSGNGTAVFSRVTLGLPPTLTNLGNASGEMFGMGFSPGTGTMYCTDIASRMFTVDVATGARTLVGANVFPGGAVVDVRGLAIVPTQPGACCGGGGSCAITAPNDCMGTFVSEASCTAQVAGGIINPCCKADFNGNGSLGVSDIFDFLAAWFAGCP